MKLLTFHDVNTVLDIGSGAGEHARLMRYAGKQVTTIDLHRDADIYGDFASAHINGMFDAVWCSHVLEHQRNPGAFLEKIYDQLKDDGVLAITVPIHSADRMVAGHISVWSAWLLCYNLVLSGFDCREAMFLTTIDLTLIVRKRSGLDRAALLAAGSGGDLFATGEDPFASIAPYFPFPVTQHGEAIMTEWNWGGTHYQLTNMQPFRIVGRFTPPEGIVIGA